MTYEPYPNGRAVEQAIRQAASQMPDRMKSRALQLAIRDRFLCRIFAADSEHWALKGGTGMLARVIQARHTQDVDLLSRDTSLDNAVAELAQAASSDFGDHFYFAHIGTRRIAAGDRQPHVEGARVDFSVRIGAKHHPNLAIDLVVGPHATQPFETREPVNRLELPRLRTVPYQLYPVVDQIADKVCATNEVHASGPSSRERDLVDLALLALTETIDSANLRLALTSEFARRGLPVPERFQIPDSWGPGFRKACAGIDLLTSYADVTRASELVATLVDPVLSSRRAGSWSPERREWLAHE